MVIILIQVSDSIDFPLKGYWITITITNLLKPTTKITLKVKVRYVIIIIANFSFFVLFLLYFSWS